MRPEPYLQDPKRTIEILQKYGLRAQKKFGQNFLIDAHVLEKIIRAAEITEEDAVLEIGPGIGTLTQYLAHAAGSVCAVEIDRNLIPVLQETLAGYDNVTVINEDILKLDLKQIADEHNHGRPLKVAANLPYYITTPVIMALLESRLPISSVTVMVQKEVADRMAALPGTPEYGALSLAVQYFTEPYLAANVPPNCFIPRPAVGSAVIRLTVHEKPSVCVKDEKLMFQIIRAAFNQRRKTLVNALKNSREMNLERDEILSAMEQCALPPNVRGEALGLPQFAQLSDALADRR